MKFSIEPPSSQINDMVKPTPSKIGLALTSNWMALASMYVIRNAECDIKIQGSRINDDGARSKIKMHMMKCDMRFVLYVVCHCALVIHSNGSVWWSARFWFLIPRNARVFLYRKWSSIRKKHAHTFTQMHKSNVIRDNLIHFNDFSRMTNFISKVISCQVLCCMDSWGFFPLRGKYFIYVFILSAFCIHMWGI